jgi:alcohol dehydrogenase
MFATFLRVVESVGEGVQDIQAGDHVVPIFNGECGNCAYCKSDKTNLCAMYRVNPLKSTMTVDGKTRFFVAGPDGRERVPVHHFLNTSTFAEYTVLDSACAVKINPKAPLDRMCLFSCGISTGNIVIHCRKLEKKMVIMREYKRRSKEILQGKT